MSRYDDDAIDYTEIDKLKAALVGRSITETIGAGGDYPAEIAFVLDDGSRLIAHATDGGCACTNGCFSVAPGSAARGTILNVEVSESVDSWGSAGTQAVQPGSVTDGSSTIRVFVYTELGKSTLIKSEGSDNGYYGWGFWLNVETPDVTS